MGPGRTGRERRRRRRRRRAGRRVQDRVAQPPELRRAVPGSRDRRRRHPARHLHDGRPPDRRHGPAAVRRPRRLDRRQPATRTRSTSTSATSSTGSSAASAGTATASASRTSAASWCSTTPTPATRWSTSWPSGCSAKDRLQLAKAERVGDLAVLLGSATGRDGIGGASVLASQEFDDLLEDKRPNVQVGDPFAEKQLIECCLELYERDLVAGIQDMGAAGIACSTSELASKASLGMDVDLDRVHLRDPTLESWEILCSESQERMLALVAPRRPRGGPGARRDVGRPGLGHRRGGRRRRAVAAPPRRGHRRPARPVARRRGTDLRPAAGAAVVARRLRRHRRRVAHASPGRATRAARR